MNELEVIEKAQSLESLQKLQYYICYWINCYPLNGNDYRKSFMAFCSENNIEHHDAGEDWEQIGFACRCWLSFNAGSLYHSIYHRIIKMQ